jgi:putative ATP-dependent endonuclease of OLD family
MPRITNISIRNYRSIKGPLAIRVPANRPLVLVGENNSGKSNVVRALELVMGEWWPGNHEPEDHEFFGREASGDPIEINIAVDDVTHVGRYGESDVVEFVWSYPPDEDVGKSLYMIFGDGERNGYVSNETRERCLCLMIGADRRLSYQLSYTSKWTLLSQLMRQFHRSLTDQPATVEELQGLFERIKEAFFDVESFASFATELDAQVEALAGNLVYGLAIDFSAYDPSNFFHALRILPKEGDAMRTFDELGTGQEQILAIAFAHAYAQAFHGGGRTLILVIEEPEAHLHPLAQEWVAKHLRALASTDGLQVIVTTHSPAFIEMLDLEGLVLLRKGDAGSTATQLAPDQLAEACRALGAPQATGDTVLPFYQVAASAEILAGFFARRILLVEGETESEALPVYLRRVGLDVTKEGVAVISVRGVGNLAKWLRLFAAYGIPTYVIFDNDTTDDAEGTRRDDLLGALGLDQEVAGRLLTATSLEVQGSAAAFGGNFEEALRDLFGEEYVNLESEASELFGLGGRSSKPLVARYVAERLSSEENHAAWQAFGSLATAVTSASTLSPNNTESDMDDIPF